MNNIIIKKILVIVLLIINLQCATSLTLLAWEDTIEDDEQSDVQSINMLNISKYNELLNIYTNKFSQSFSTFKISSILSSIQDTIEQQSVFNYKDDDNDNIDNDVITSIDNKLFLNQYDTQNNEEKQFQHIEENNSNNINSNNNNDDSIDMNDIIDSIDSHNGNNSNDLTNINDINNNINDINNNVNDFNITDINDFNNINNIDTNNNDKKSRNIENDINDTTQNINIIEEITIENENADTHTHIDTDSDITADDEGDALKEILELQRLEEEELLKEQELIKSDTDLIIEAEKLEKEQEAKRAAERRANHTTSKTHKYDNTNTNTNNINTNIKVNSFNSKKTGLGGIGRKTEKKENVNIENSLFTTGSKTNPNRSEKSKFDGIESLLSKELSDKVNERSEQELEKYNRQIRNKISRKYARPVEKIIKVYENPKTTLYQVLSLPEDADYDDIKKTYRTMALILHPDKNPHPDAKKAFDAIQDAFEVLTSPTKRSTYDKKLSRRSGMTSKKIIKKIKTEWYNLKSRLLLLIHRIRKGEGKEELDELVISPSKQLIFKVFNFGEKAVSLPLFDRVLLLLEIYEDNWKILILSSFFISLVF